MSKVKILGEERFSGGCFDIPGVPKTTAVMLQYVEPDEGDLCQDMKDTLYEDSISTYHKSKNVQVWLTDDPRIIKAAELIVALD